ncbi:hypothetical protein TNCV_29981 [Trichonephila clavipes]|nr:hypothetical protein TNCV_29981 [Trichonephila clavipes]
MVTVRDNRSSRPASRVDITIGLKPSGFGLETRGRQMYFLREKESDFRLQWIPVSNGKQRTPSVICWDHQLL